MTFAHLANAAARAVSDFTSQEWARERYRLCVIHMVKTTARSLSTMGPCARQANLYAVCHVPPGQSVEISLERGIAAEVQRSGSGHWAFDPNRLIALRAHRLVRRYERRKGMNYDEQTG